MTIAGQVVAEAREWIGTPYAHQHSLKHVGTDCLGLIRGVYRDVIGEEPEQPPPYSADWAEAKGRELMLEAAEKYLIRRDTERDAIPVPGDVWFFRYRPTAGVKHCAIIASPTTMIHAYNNLNTQEVTISAFWIRLLAAVYAFPEK